MARRLFTDAECKAKARRLAREVAAGKFGTPEEAKGVMEKLYRPPDAAVILAMLMELGAIPAN